MLTFEVRGINPLPKERPRKGVSRGGKSFIYTPTKTKNYEEEMGIEVGNLMVSMGLDSPLYPLDSEVGIIAHFIRETRHKVDTDNLVKSLKDGLEGVLWENDKSVRGDTSYISYNKVNPGVILVVMPYDDWLQHLQVERYAGSITDQGIPPKYNSISVYV